MPLFICVLLCVYHIECLLLCVFRVLFSYQLSRLKRNNIMSTTAGKAKEAGYKSLLNLAWLSGWPVRTLQDMDANHPKRFNTVLNGAKANKEGGK